MLVDGYSREFKYLRLSITEKCNFKCSYCLPDGYAGCDRPDFLSLDEIKNLAKAFKELGIRKIRLTGGEPTLRADILGIISALKHEIGIQEIALTTNGFRLPQIGSELKAAGLDSINISLDSLRPERFYQICGSRKGESVLRSIDDCIGLGFKNVKINCVLLKNLNENEFPDFVEFVKARPVSVRFIELMRTGDNKEYFSKHHIPLVSKVDELIENGWALVPEAEIGGPAKEFQSSRYRGKIGFISPYSKNFCSTCNRLRVSSVGGLRLCLFGDGEVSLRDLLQDGSDRELLKEKVTVSLRMKPAGHRLHQNVFGDMNTLSAIGG